MFSLAAFGGIAETTETPKENIILLLLLVIATVYLVMRIKKRGRQKMEEAQERYREIAEDEAREQRKSRPVKGSPAPAGSSPKADVQHLYVELHEFAREIEARLDTKIAYLKRLMDEAAMEGESLGRLIERAENLPAQVPSASRPEPNASASNPSTPSPAAPPPALSPTESAEPAVKKTADTAPSPPEATPTADKPAEPVVGSTVDLTVGGLPGEEGDAKGDNGRILDLHRQGKNPADIAAEVGLPKGEVELIIQLDKSQSERPVP